MRGTLRHKGTKQSTDPGGLLLQWSQRRVEKKAVRTKRDV